MNYGTHKKTKYENSPVPETTNYVLLLDTSFVSIRVNYIPPANDALQQEAQLLQMASFSKFRVCMFPQGSARRV